MSVGIFNSEDQSLVKLASNSITADETIETLNDVKVSVATDKASVAADKATVSADKADIVSMKSEIANTKTIINETAQMVSENANSVKQEKIAIDETKTDIDKKYTEISNTATKLNTEYNNLTSNYYTKEATNSLISSTTKPKYSVVNELPTSDISTDIIYLKSTNTTSTDGVYEMYTYQDSNWVKIGTSNPDLADYYTKELADSTFATKTEINNTNSNVSQLKEDLSKISDRFNISYGKNRYNGICEDGYLKDDGTLTFYGDWKTTDYIDVKNLENVIYSYADDVGKRYDTTPMYFLTTYGENKNRLTQIDNPQSTYTVEDNVCFIRFSYHADTNYQNMVESGTVSSVYEEYKEINKLSNSDYTTDEEVKVMIDEKISQLEMVTIYGKNRYTGKNDVSGYLNSDGVIAVAGDWKTTDFVNVDGFLDVVCSSSSTDDGSRNDTSIFFCWTYDKDKNKLRNITNYPVTFTLEAGEKYIRFAYHSNEIYDLQLEGGTSKTTYEPCTEKTVPKISVPWYGKRWVAVGDSITEVNSRTTMHYHDYIANDTGISVINFGSSGTGYKRSEEQNKAFYQRVTSIPTGTDVVTIFGSVNDMALINSLGEYTDTTTDTICGCINKTIDTIIERNPLVSLGIVSPIPNYDNNPVSYGGNVGAMDRYTEALKKICEYRSIPFLDLYHCSNLRPWTEEGRKIAFSKDIDGMDGNPNGTHPDENGNKLIAPRFKAFLETLLM